MGNNFIIGEKKNYTSNDGIQAANVLSNSPAFAKIMKNPDLRNKLKAGLTLRNDKALFANNPNMRDVYGGLLNTITNYETKGRTFDSNNLFG